MYGLSAGVAGAVFGLMITTALYLLTFWIPMQLKLWFLLVMISVYMLREFKLVQVPVPQMKWQVPTSWLIHTPKWNMCIWGTILGAGIFTYNPHSTFFLLHLTLGLLYNPLLGLIIGAVYGIGRVLPTFLIAVLQKRSRGDKLSPILQQLPELGKWSYVFHGLLLLMLLINLIYSI